MSTKNRDLESLMAQVRGLIARRIADNEIVAEALLGWVRDGSGGLVKPGGIHVRVPDFRSGVLPAELNFPESLRDRATVADVNELLSALRDNGFSVILDRVGAVVQRAGKVTSSSNPDIVRAVVEAAADAIWAQDFLPDASRRIIETRLEAARLAE